MALTAETRQVLADLDAETTRIADLIAGIDFDADENEIRAELNPILDRMRNIAHNPEQPIPPIEP